MRGSARSTSCSCSNAHPGSICPRRRAPHRHPSTSISGTRSQTVSALLSMTSPHLKVVVSEAEAPNSWFRDRDSEHRDLTFSPKTKHRKRGWLHSMETITQPLNLHERWGFLRRAQKDVEKPVQVRLMTLWSQITYIRVIWVSYFINLVMCSDEAQLSD